MTMLNPPLRNARLERATAAQDQPLKAQLERARETVQSLVAFVDEEHLTVQTLHSFWRHEQRAVMTLRAVGQQLALDLAGTARSVADLLDFSATMPLADFQADEAAHLFATIDSIEPDEIAVGDGRAAAERFQYAAEARTALLGHTLAVLSQRYPAPTFANLSEATVWTSAFTALLEEAAQVIEGTQQLLTDEATALQSHIDTLWNRFQLLDEQARAAAVAARDDWRSLLEETEARLLDVLGQRYERLGALAFGEGQAVRQTNWLQALTQGTVRRAPLVGSLLLTLAGGATLLSPTTRAALPAVATDALAQMSNALADARPFPVLARHLSARDVAGRRAHDQIAQFFATREARPRGRQTLTIQDPATLRRVVDELAAFGYAPQEVLRLLGLNSSDDLRQPISVDVRWSQGGRPLLLPAYEPPAAPVAPAPDVTAALPVRFEGAAQPITSMVVHWVNAGETLAALAARYGLTPDALRADNRLAGDALVAGQALLVRVNGLAVGVAPVPRAFDSPHVHSRGSFPTTAAPAAIAPTLPTVPDGAALAARYGSQVFPSVAAMPDDARLYFTTTVQEVADFFNVRPGDIVGILQAENNNAGLRIHQPAVSSAGARGVAQIVARTWNGWASPQTESHSHDLRAIEQYGGLGFDWAMRDEWRAWQEGRSDGSALASSDADPNRFENSVAGVARHLVHWGLTRDRAASDPAWFRARLGDAISVYNSGRTLAEAEGFTQSAANHKTTGQYVREAIAVSEATPMNLVATVVAPSTPLRDAFARLVDQTFGVALSEDELAGAVDGSAVAAQVAAGRLAADQGAQSLLQDALTAFVADGRAARDAGEPLGWPFVYDEASLEAQRLAVQQLGHTLTAWEVEALVDETGGDAAAMARALSQRGDARLFAGVRQRFDQLLRRSERGLPVATHEVAAVMMPALAGYNPLAMSQGDLQHAMDGVERAIRHLPEFGEVHGVTGFAAMPLSPMPRTIKGFGVAVTYQAGGRHTGIDIANPLVNGQEPLIFAVGDATVVHVGPLYCAAATMCRGGNAIVLDHGNQVYSLYSHNSAADVQVGQRVSAGQPIGRQGDQGYSFGSHLHFEVHTGAPFSGNWEEPFAGGQFVDPMEWLPGR